MKKVRIFRAWFSHFTRLVRDWWFVCLVVVLGLVCFALIIPDLSSSFCCLIMAILAQFNNCHSCHDARSIDQKKNIIPLIMFVFGELSILKLRFDSHQHGLMLAAYRDVLFTSFTSKNANISRALFSFLLLQSVLIGFPCRCKALWIGCRTYDRA